LLDTWLTSIYNLPSKRLSKKQQELNCLHPLIDSRYNKKDYG
jgi:hypothetical protein